MGLVVCPVILILPCDYLLKYTMFSSWNLPRLFSSVSSPSVPGQAPSQHARKSSGADRKAGSRLGFHLPFGNCCQVGKNSVTGIWYFWANFHPCRHAPSWGTSFHSPPSFVLLPPVWTRAMVRQRFKISLSRRAGAPNVRPPRIRGGTLGDP